MTTTTRWEADLADLGRGAIELVRLAQSDNQHEFAVRLCRWAVNLGRACRWDDQRRGVSPALPDFTEPVNSLTTLFLALAGDPTGRRILVEALSRAGDEPPGDFGGCS